MKSKDLLMLEVKTVYSIIAAAQKTLLDIQLNCPHPPETLRKEYESNTGGYDPSDDCYWVKFDCYICGKHWTAKAGTEEYHRKGMIHDKWHDEPRLG
jgi:hypothetical protein